MKDFLALGFFILGVIGGLYVGCYEFFFKGLILTIDSIKATPVESFSLAIGIVKMIVSGFLGFLISQTISSHF